VGLADLPHRAAAGAPDAAAHRRRYLVIIAYLAWAWCGCVLPGWISSIVATSAMITAVVAFAMQDTWATSSAALPCSWTILSRSATGSRWTIFRARGRYTLAFHAGGNAQLGTVVFPNSQLMKNKFLVLDGAPTSRCSAALGVVQRHAEHDADQVVNAVESAILQAEINNVAKSPRELRADEMDKGCARYALRYWLTDLRGRSHRRRCAGMSTPRWSAPTSS